MVSGSHPDFVISAVALSAGAVVGCGVAGVVCLSMSSAVLLVIESESNVLPRCDHSFLLIGCAGSCVVGVADVGSGKKP